MLKSFWNHNEPPRYTDIFGHPLHGHKHRYARLAKTYQHELRKIKLTSLYSQSGYQQLSDNVDAFYQQYPLIKTINQMIKTDKFHRGPIMSELKALPINQSVENEYRNDILDYFNIVISLQRGPKVYQPLLKVLENQANKIEAYQDTKSAKIKWLRQKALPKLMEKVDIIIDSQFAYDNYALVGYHQRYQELLALDDESLIDALFSVGVHDSLKDDLFPKLELLHSYGDGKTEDDLIELLFKQYNRQPDMLNLLALLETLDWSESYVSECYTDILLQIKQLQMDTPTLKAYIKQRVEDIENFSNPNYIGEVSYELSMYMNDKYGIDFDIGANSYQAYTDLVSELNQIIAGLILDRPLVGNQYIN